MAKIDNKEKILLLTLGLSIIAFIFLTFEGLTYSLVNIGGEEQVMVNSEQTYTIDMKVTPPDQFKTLTHYREQYADWKVVDENNNTIINSPTTPKKINGSYYNQVTIIIPEGYKKLYFVAWIVEYQYSKPDSGDTFVKLDIPETLKTETLTINIIECTTHSDCNELGMCTGQYGWCREDNTCEVKGKCEECITNDDCKTGICQNNKCYEELTEQKTPLVQQVQDTFGTGISENSAASKESTPLLTTLVIIMGLILGILIYRRVKK